MSDAVSVYAVNVGHSHEAACEAVYSAGQLNGAATLQAQIDAAANIAPAQTAPAAPPVSAVEALK